MIKLENIHQLVKKHGDNKLTAKFHQIFELLFEMLLFPEKLKQTPCLEFAKSVKQKTELLVKTFENTYTEILIEQSIQNERISQVIKDCLENRQDANEIQRKAYQDIIELRNKYKDFEVYFKEKVNYNDYAQGLENEFTKIKAQALAQEVGELKDRAEHLSRRIRLLMLYSPESIASKLANSEDINISLQDENFECVCGGS